MTKERQSADYEALPSRGSSLGLDSSFVIRASSFSLLSFGQNRLWYARRKRDLC
jgi:hypothetical protein